MNIYLLLVMLPMFQVVAGKCLPGWSKFGDRCARQYDYETTFQLARQVCRDSGGELLMIRSSQEEQLAARSFIDPAGTWIGVKDFGTNDYKYLTGEPMTYSNWHDGEPNNIDTEKCVEHETIGWNNVPCGDDTILKKFTCETNQRKCLQDWHEFDDKCARHYNYEATFAFARHVCMASGGDLLMIRSSHQAQLAFGSLIDPAPTWIGVKDFGTNDYKYLNGEPLTYSNWQDGEPNNIDTEKCVEYESDGWNNVPCGNHILKEFTCQNYQNLCAEGWMVIGDKCGKVFNEKNTWNAARETCKTFGGDLLEIRSKMQNDFVKAFAEKHSKHIWIGLTDFNSPGTFKYVGGEAVTEYSNWLPTQPDFFRGKEHCAELHISGEWNDNQCHHMQSYACQTDQREECATNEVVGSDNKCHKCQDDTWIAIGNHCFKAFDDPKPWEQAKEQCEKENSRLSTWTDGRTLTGLLDNKERYWVGYTDKIDEGVFQSSNGNTLDNTFDWNTKQPNDEFGFADGEDCVEMRGSDGKFNDELCASYRPFLCQSNPSQ